MIYGHGDDFCRAQLEVKANFSTNVWYGADTHALNSFLSGCLGKIFHYPEPDAASFRKAVAVYHEMQPENVLAGNGATELFYLIAHAFAGKRTVLPVPSFKEYEDACSLYNHQLIFLQGTAVVSLPEAVSLMFICNPNNPDGRIWTQGQIRLLLDKYPELTLVVDESFIHFAPEADSAIPLLKEYPNLLIVRSMTKCYAIPGLRLGYVLGDSRMTELLARYAQPWSVNALAVEAGKYLLECREKDLPDAVDLLRRQYFFSTQIAAIRGFEPQPSHTSFFLVKTDYNAACLKQYLLEHHGILIRDASNFRGLDEHYFRINTLTEEKNEMLIRGLCLYGEMIQKEL